METVFKLIGIMILFLAFRQVEEPVYTVVEKSAEPIGGMPAFYKAVSESLSFPKGNTCGVWKVFIKFIIETDGTTSNFKMMKDGTTECEKVWLEPFKKISKEILWHPGEIKGAPVRQRFVLPLEVKPG